MFNPCTFEEQNIEIRTVYLNVYNLSDFAQNTIAGTHFKGKTNSREWTVTGQNKIKPNKGVNSLVN